MHASTHSQVVVEPSHFRSAPLVQTARDQIAAAQAMSRDARDPRSLDPAYAQARRRQSMIQVRACMIQWLSTICTTADACTRSITGWGGQTNNRAAHGGFNAAPRVPKRLGRRRCAHFVATCAAMIDLKAALQAATAAAPATAAAVTMRVKALAAQQGIATARTSFSLQAWRTRWCAHCWLGQALMPTQVHTHHGQAQ